MTIEDGRGDTGAKSESGQEGLMGVGSKTQASKNGKIKSLQGMPGARDRDRDNGT